SMTVPIINPDAAPVSTMLDETNRGASTRCDNRILVGGMAEKRVYDLKIEPRNGETMEMNVNALLPADADTSEIKLWIGLRPATTDGTPIIGPTRYRNLFLNTGHGTLGWTMACGSGRLLADLLARKKPQISTEGLAISRYSNNKEASKHGNPATAH